MCCSFNLQRFLSIICYHLFNFICDAVTFLRWQQNNKFTLVIDSASHCIFLLVLGVITAVVELHRLVFEARIWIDKE